MNVLKPFDDCFLSNEDAIRDLEDYVVVSDVDLDDIVTVNGIEVVRSDYEAVNNLVPGYSFGKMVGESRILFSEKRVSYLSLSEMGLESLSGEIGKLSGLKTLVLYNNELSVLPAEVGTLTRLEDLDLIHNSLSVLPVEFGNLINLEYLVLGYNDLSVLPVEIGSLAELRELYLSNNSLSVLPEELCGLPNLKTLYVDNNPLSNHSIVDKLEAKGVEVYT